MGTTVITRLAVDEWVSELAEFHCRRSAAAPLLLARPAVNSVSFATKSDVIELPVPSALLKVAPATHPGGLVCVLAPSQYERLELVASKSYAE
jgi:hypothetical protein